MCCIKSLHTSIPLLLSIDVFDYVDIIDHPQQGPPTVAKEHVTMVPSKYKNLITILVKMNWSLMSWMDEVSILCTELASSLCIIILCRLILFHHRRPLIDTHFPYNIMETVRFEFVFRWHPGVHDGCMLLNSLHNMLLSSENKERVNCNGAGVKIICACLHYYYYGAIIIIIVAYNTIKT